MSAPDAVSAEAPAEDAGGAAWPAQDLESVDRCPACGQPARTLLHPGLTDSFGVAPGRWDLHRCAACGSAYLDPRPTTSSIHRAYAAYYTHVPPTPEPSPVGRVAYARRALRNGYVNRGFGYTLVPAWRVGTVLVRLSPWHRAATDTCFRHLRLPYTGAQLLDVGCGNGDFLVRMAELGWQAEGVEPDPTAAALARAAGLEVYEAPLETLGEREYDAITMCHVIEHLPDPPAAIRAAHRLLRPGGVLWIATPNLHGVGYRRFGRHSRVLDPPRHLVIFSRSGLGEALRRGGFHDQAWPRPAGDTVQIFQRSAAIARGELLDAREREFRRTVTWRTRAARVRSFVRTDLDDELVVLVRKPARQ